MIKTDYDYICSITLLLKSNEYQPNQTACKSKCIRIQNKAQCYVNFSLKYSTAGKTLFKLCESHIIRLMPQPQSNRPDIYNFPTNSTTITSFLSRKFIPNNFHHNHHVSSKVLLNFFFRPKSFLNKNTGKKIHTSLMFTSLMRE